MGGNIGLPILAQDPLPEGGVYVLELSSYQIDLTQSLDCDVAVLLNITPDHLDRYESFEAYAASKARLFEMQSRRRARSASIDQSMTPSVDRRMASLDRRCRSRRQSIDFIDDQSTIGDQARLACAARPAQSRRMPPPLSQSAELLGVSIDKIAEGLRTFPGLPHRMERVRETDGVLFVNDSKATNAEAAAPALAAYPRGALDRRRAGQGGDAGRYRQASRPCRRAPIPSARRGRCSRGCCATPALTSIECETLENAVKRAAEDSQAGETVLLSPACASFDQFRDFEARGDRFRELVEAL